MGRILVVDDDESMRAALRLLLEGMGHKVVEAGNGLEGVAAFRRDPTPIIMIDLMMPKKSGFEAIGDLRKDYPSVQIIAMSGGLAHGPEAFLELAKMLGAQHVLKKPFLKSELRKVLATVDWGT